MPRLHSRMSPEPSGQILPREHPEKKEVSHRMEMLSTLYLRACEFVARKRDRDQEGQGMVEYALILVLIAIVVIVIIQVVGKQVNNVFSNISNGLGQ